MNDVVFRRIHGRIVPIRLTADQKSRIKQGATGAAMVAGGLGIAAASGNFYRKAVVKSADSAMKSFRAIEDLGEVFKKSKVQQTLFDFAKKSEQQGKMFDALRRSSRIANISKVIKGAAIPIGAALVTVGAIKAINAVPKKNRKDVNPALVAGGAAAAVVLAPKAGRLAKEAFEAGIGGKQGVFNFGSRKFASVSPYLKRFGELAFKAVF